MDAKVNIKRRITFWLICILVIVVLIWSARGVNVNLPRFLSGFPAIGRIMALMFPPDWSYLDNVLIRMLQSLHIALLGTALGSLLAIPIGFIAARNLTVYRMVSWVGKQLLNAIRTFPELILAVFFVAAFGPGQLAGLMAVGIHSIGMLGKLYADIIEGIDQGPSEALKASGANKIEILWYAVFPQVLPEFVATSLYRFEINLRAATVLGMVGAGGIGVILDQALKYRRWAVVGMALLTIVIGVTIIDYSSAYLRKRIIQGE
jgi:phosphonate transport system permease protein